MTNRRAFSLILLMAGAAPAQAHVHDLASSDQVRLELTVEKTGL